MVGKHKLLEFLCAGRGQKVPAELDSDILQELELGKLEQCPMFQWDKNPNDISSSQVHMLLQLGTGGRGRCFLGVTPEGSMCVRKYFLPRYYSLRERAGPDCRAWNKVYFNHSGKKECFVDETGRGRVYLQIPYIGALADTVEGEMKERQRLLQEGDQGALAQALRFFASRGYRHLSLKWKHVGRESTLPGSKIMFYDLGNIETPWSGKESDQEKWVKECLNDLREEME
jgi:hypothetical protein